MNYKTVNPSPLNPSVFISILRLVPLEKDQSYTDGVRGTDIFLFKIIVPALLVVVSKENK
ncbi:hypothetical protein H5410_062402 [Solanum commersonii]|uniref:Uncharacterized protein n=1 Tax=Solanum commersonii TaxID=4109 RepID=A0A9J5WBG9_SOLCO|nr:hypothetical protein H5410_062402 [Solanum commersonii]